MSIITCEQNLINNGINTSDTDGDLIFKCIKFIGNKTDTAITQLGLLPPDVSSFTAAMAALQVDVNKLKSYNVVNVKEYGAIGNGIVDDTNSIQNAINALSDNQMLYFPNGRYKITNTLNISNKTFLNISSDNATIVSYTTGVLININNCDYLNINGNLKIYLDASIGKLSTTKGIYLNGCDKFNIINIQIYGLFYFGLEIENIIYSESHSLVSHIYIQDSQIGIRVKTAEYVDIVNCVVVHCDLYGLLMQGGNFCINGGIYSYNNRVGIYVNGLESLNPDHANINGCLINHNYYCGILLQNIILGMNISNCQIWPVNGYDDGRVYNFTEVISTYGKASANCIYLENVVSVSINNCCLAYADNCVCCDGWANCIISNNTFKAANDISNFWVVEVGETNTLTSNINRNNIMTNNTCYGVNKFPQFDFFMVHDTFSANANSDYNYIIKNNLGLSKSHILNINTIGTYIIGSSDYNLIDANVIGLSSMPSNDPSGINSQATSITIQPYVKGQQIDIQFYNTNLTNYWVWIRFKTDDTTTVLKTVGNGIMQHIAVNKAICINARICNKISFIPYGNGDNQWVVCGYAA